MDYRLLTALTAVIVVAAVLIPAGIGWRRRRLRDEAWAALPALPADIEDRVSTAHVDGMYVATTVHGDPLRRLVGHHLGVRTRARVLLYEDGLLIDRTGAEPVWIAADRVTGYGTGSGMVGKFVEPGGLVMVTWLYHGRSVDTGFRPQSGEGRPVLLEALDGYAASASAPDAASAADPRTTPTQEDAS